MFPSISINNDINNTDLFSYEIDQSILLKPFLSEISIPNSKQLDDPLLSFFQLPSPFIHYFDFELQDPEPNFLQPSHSNHDEILLNQQQQHGQSGLIMMADHTASETVSNMADSSKNTHHSFNNGSFSASKDCRTESTKQVISTPDRKRSCKRDRHSKINTAKGPRDRRMRLSLEVAKEFFGLQDMLGYEKASKTVEWLLIQARTEIKKLVKSFPGRTNYSCSTGASSTSECEVISGILNSGTHKRNKAKETDISLLAKEKKIKQLRKRAFCPLAKDLRAKARERARARTREKFWNRKLDEESKLRGEDQAKENYMNNQLAAAGSLSDHFEVAGDQESGTQRHSNVNLSPKMIVPEVEEEIINPQKGHLGIQEAAMVDESLVIMDKYWSPSSIDLNYLHHNGISQEVSSN